jgi:hypothetical protein
MRISPMTKNVFCGKRPLIALAATLCLIFPVSNESARAQVFPAAGSTYYVSPDGSDKAAGTEGAPFRTIQRAASLVSAGDTVIVRAGTYAGFQLDRDFPRAGPRRSRSPSEPIRGPSFRAATARLLMG